MELGLFELLVVIILGIIILGPEKLPEFAQTVGRYVREFNKLRSMLEEEIRREMSPLEKPSARKPKARRKMSRRELLGKGGLDEEVKNLARDLGISTEGKTQQEVISEIRRKVIGGEDGGGD